MYSIEYIGLHFGLTFHFLSREFGESILQNVNRCCQKSCKRLKRWFVGRRGVRPSMSRRSDLDILSKRFLPGGSKVLCPREARRCLNASFFTQNWLETRKVFRFLTVVVLVKMLHDFLQQTRVFRRSRCQRLEFVQPFLGEL